MPALVAFCGGISEQIRLKQFYLRTESQRWFTLATGVGTLVTFSRVSPTEVVFISDLKHWITSLFSITLFTNFSCTGQNVLISRIQYAH